MKKFRGTITDPQHVMERWLPWQNHPKVQFPWDDLCYKIAPQMEEFRLETRTQLFSESITPMKLVATDKPFWHVSPISVLIHQLVLIYVWVSSCPMHLYLYTDKLSLMVLQARNSSSPSLLRVMLLICPSLGGCTWHKVVFKSERDLTITSLPCNNRSKSFDISSWLYRIKPTLTILCCCRFGKLHTSNDDAIKRSSSITTELVLAAMQ